MPTNGDEGQDETRANTAKRLINFLKEDELPTLKSGNRTDQKEPAIYTNELQRLTKQNWDKLHHISQLVNQASKATEEEKQARRTLNSYISDSEEIHSPLREKFEKVDKI